MVPKNDLKRRNMPYSWETNPARVQKGHPRTIRMRPRKKKALPFSFDYRPKKPAAPLRPTIATTPITNAIYTNLNLFLTFPIASMARSRKNMIPRK